MVDESSCAFCVYGHSRQCAPNNKQLHLSITILVIIVTEYNVRGQALKVTEVDIADISDLSLSGVKNSRPPKSVYVGLSFGASNALPNGVGSP